MAEANLSTRADQAETKARWNGVVHALTLRVSERRLLLIALDAMAVNGALLLALNFRSGQNLTQDLLFQKPHWFLILSVIWFPLAFACDAYDLHVSARISTAITSVSKAAVITGVVYLFIPYVSFTLPSSRLSVVVFLLLLFGLLVTERCAYILGVAQPHFYRRVLIIGAGPAGRIIAKALLEHDDGTTHIVGFIDDDPPKRGAEIRIKPAKTTRSDSETFNVLGDRHALKGLILQHGVTTLVLAITDEVKGELLQVMMDCLELGVSIIPLSILYERLTGRVPVEHVGGSWYVAMPIHHAGGGALFPIIKRLTDIINASLGLLFLGLLTPFIALAIRLDSPGPIFYSQDRVGRGGRRFKVYKFRSMVQNAENGQAVWAQQNDSRVTRVGRWLRRTHLDEFLQFLNILKGEMSIVGPRPERPEFVEELARDIPFYRIRHAVRPGTAGWALVKSGYGASKEDALVKLQYDLYYIKHQSLWLDLVILLKTAVHIAFLRGR